jgi:hypothetical protein
MPKICAFENLVLIYTISLLRMHRKLKSEEILKMLELPPRVIKRTSYF